jgi:prolyl oligopeptidase
MRGDMLYLRAYTGAPRGRVIALPLKDPVLARAREVVAEPTQGVLRQFGLDRDALYTEVQLGFNTRVMRHAKGTPRDGQDIAPGQAGSTFLIGDPAHAQRQPWVGTSSWTDLPRVLAVEAGGTTRDTGLRNSQRPAGAPELEVAEVMVPSHDGVRVPLAVIQRKGLARDGSNPTLLIGYGAYGFTFEAYYDPRALAWLERGGVIAFANVRGSGAFGDEWHRAGFKTTKPNTWKDGIACARWLIEQRYASPATMGIWGTVPAASSSTARCTRRRSCAPRVRRRHARRRALGGVGQRHHQHLGVRHRKGPGRIRRAAGDEHLPPDQGRQRLSRSDAGARHERPARGRVEQRQGGGAAAGRQQQR